jgi:nucleoside-diphosphate-sugar epimerase
MAVLITGAKGFIGSRLSALLKENGFDTVFFEGDIINRSQVLDWQTNKKIDQVIHLANVTNKKDRKIFRSVNIEGTRNIVDYCKKNNIERLIFLSSIKVLSRLANPYNESKREAEKIIIASGVPFIILRPSMVYGPGDKKNIGFMVKLAKTLPLIPGFGFRMQLVFVDDLARMIMASLNLKPGQIINIAGRTVSFSDLLKVLKGQGCKFSIINWPKFFAAILKTAGRLGLMSMPAWQVESLLADEIFDESDWHKIFNIKETSLDEGLIKTIM